MKRLLALVSIAALPSASYAAAYGSLNNFDVINDTGNKCYGFEIELDDLHSTDITYTYDYNHYLPAPTITEDNSIPGHSKVFVRYAAKKNPDSTWASWTNPQDPVHPLGPTAGHAFTNPGVNQGGEHFGVGYIKSPSSTKYNWLIDDGKGNLALGPAVTVATPAFTYVPPIPAAPGQPAVPAQVQQVVVVPPPEVPEPQWGTPYWMKVFTTTQPWISN